MDTTKLGEVAAVLMERLALEADEEDMELGEVMIVAEVNGKDEDDGWTGIAYRCSDDRTWVQCGLLHAALRMATNEDIRD